MLTTFQYSAPTVSESATFVAAEASVAPSVLGSAEFVLIIPSCVLSVLVTLCLLRAVV
jgi:hypothetical protein